MLDSAAEFAAVTVTHSARMTHNVRATVLPPALGNHYHCVGANH